MHVRVMPTLRRLSVTAPRDDTVFWNAIRPFVDELVDEGPDEMTITPAKTLALGLALGGAGCAVVRTTMPSADEHAATTAAGEDVGTSAPERISNIATPMFIGALGIRAGCLLRPDPPAAGAAAQVGAAAIKAPNVVKLALLGGGALVAGPVLSAMTANSATSTDDALTTAGVAGALAIGGTALGLSQRFGPRAGTAAIAGLGAAAGLVLPAAVVGYARDF